MRRRDHDVAGALGAASAGRAATPPRGGPRRPRAAHRPGCAPSTSRTRRPRTVAIRMPSWSRCQSQPGDRADRGGVLLAAAERGEVVRADQRRGGDVHRRPRPACGARRGCPGRAVARRRTARWRPGTRSGGTAPRTGRRTRAASRLTAVTRTSGGSSPDSRRTSESSSRAHDVGRRRRCARPDRWRARRRRYARRPSGRPRRRRRRCARARRAVRPRPCADPAAPPIRRSRCRRRRRPGVPAELVQR